jgi:hypothetical protein
MERLDSRIDRGTGNGCDKKNKKKKKKKNMRSKERPEK